MARQTLVIIKNLYNNFKNSVEMCNTIWGKVNFRLELYHCLFPGCLSEERQLNKVQFFFQGKKTTKQTKSNIEEEDICFYNYVLRNWDCAPPDDVLYSLSSTQAVRLIFFPDCSRISQVFRSSQGVFMHLMCQMAWEGMGHRAGGRCRGEDHSVQREKKDFKGDCAFPELHLQRAVQGPAQLCHITAKLVPLF